MSALRRRRRRPAAPRRRVTPDLLVGTAAVLLSLAALVVSVVQTRILAAQQRSAVWPRLAAGADHLDDVFRYSITNVGVGPAIVREVGFSVHGRRYPSVSQMAYREVLDAMGDTAYAAGKMYNDIAPGAVLRPGDSAELFSTRHSLLLADRLDALQADSSFHARILYSDVYGVCWAVDNRTVREAGRCADAEQ